MEAADMREVTPLHLFAASVPKQFRSVGGIKPTSKQRNLWHWIEHIEPHDTWAYVLGSRSSGKTRMATVAVYKMLAHDGTTALYLTASQLAKLIRSVDDEDAQWMLRVAGECDLLVIDGLGDEYRSNTSVHFHDSCAELLYDRRDRKLTTMITSRFELRSDEGLNVTYGEDSQLVELLEGEGVVRYELG